MNNENRYAMAPDCDAMADAAEDDEYPDSTEGQWIAAYDRWIAAQGEEGEGEALADFLEVCADFHELLVNG